MAGRVIHASLHLLDRQVVSNREGTFVAKVDDVEIDLEADEPHVVALLTGPQALGPRLPGLLGAFVQSVHRRLHPDREPVPNPIPASRIVDITAAVHIDSRAGLRVQGFGEWVEEHVTSRIPGGTA